MSEWYLDNNIQSELSNDWLDKPEIVREVGTVGLQLDPDMIRQDLTMKSNQGFLGQIKDREGYTMTEQSFDVDIDGKNVLMPLLVPGLSKEEVASIKDNKPLDSVYKKAQDHGMKRVRRGLSPFYQDGEEVIQQRFYGDDRNITLESDEVPIGDMGKDVTEEIKVNRASQVKDYFSKQGYSKEAVAGILGNIDVESGGTFDSTIKQRDTGTAIGIYQMEPPMRRAYESWLKNNKLEDSGISQSKYIDALIQGTDKSHPKDGGPYLGKGNSDKIKSLLKKAKTAEEAAILFQDYVEKPGKPHTDRRIEAANKFYESN